MSGPLNTPGTLTIQYLDTDDVRSFPISSGPWCYAEWLCWKPADSNVTTYAPLVNVATWSKKEGSP